MKNSKGILVKSKIKETVKAAGLRIGSAALESAEKQVHTEIENACNRAKANKRKTVQAQDFTP